MFLNLHELKLVSSKSILSRFESIILQFWKLQDLNSTCFNIASLYIYPLKSNFGKELPLQLSL